MGKKVSDEFKISIPEHFYVKLKKIADKLNTSINKLVELALTELFGLIQQEPEIFLESIGFTEELRDVVKSN